MSQVNGLKPTGIEKKDIKHTTQETWQTDGLSKGLNALPFVICGQSQTKRTIVNPDKVNEDTGLTYREASFIRQKHSPEELQNFIDKYKDDPRQADVIAGTIKQACKGLGTDEEAFDTAFNNISIENYTEINNALKKTYGKQIEDCIKEEFNSEEATDYAFKLSKKVVLSYQEKLNKIKEENKQITDENSTLKNQNTELQNKNTILQSNTTRLQGTINTLYEENDRLQETINTLYEENYRLQEDNKQLKNKTKNTNTYGSNFFNTELSSTENTLYKQNIPGYFNSY